MSLAPETAVAPPPASVMDPYPKPRLPPVNNTSHASSSFQKFRLQQEVELESQPSSVEKKRRVLFHEQEKTSLTITTSLQQGNGGAVKVCARCRTSHSPEWRRGPDGHKTLCNACGLRYSRFRTKQWRKTTK
ncbi:hypothetical protein INT47_010868 [Mucor saturninus]|uniref:GATA-type domain-containing protein n=1 Tax=Mucor saturninus TaxID=64648 RepID=A0A8H7RAS9_9FUNG|nr:hypothetical protein INT47_010868 [Mucor saturninus]